MTLPYSMSAPHDTPHKRVLLPDTLRKHFLLPDISPLDRTLLPDIQAAIDNLNKPKGSLGALERLAEQICLVQQTLQPRLCHPCHLLFAADHGIEREKGSAPPREVTWQQMANFTRGGGGVNMFCRQHGVTLRLVDVGVDHDLTAYDGIINRKLANGTANFRNGTPAMTAAQLAEAMAIGSEQVDACCADGCNIICIGEMGIGNTSPSSLWMCLMGGVPLEECVGAGAGLNPLGIRHKFSVLKESLERFLNNNTAASTLIIMQHFGGFEMVAAVGAMLRAAERDMIIMVDGFIMTACALAATQLCPAARERMVFGHAGDESGHRRLLRLLDAEPLLSLGLRLGEGTGALCAYPLVESAVRMINEMNNFNDAHITKYF